MKQMMRVAAMAIAGMMALSAAVADASLREGARSFTSGDGVAYFSCVEILAYCVMSNHFHCSWCRPRAHCARTRFSCACRRFTHGSSMPERRL